MTHTVGVVVGVAYMLTWTDHRSAGVVTLLLSTNNGRMTLNYYFSTTRDLLKFLGLIIALERLSNCMSR